MSGEGNRGDDRSTRRADEGAAALPQTWTVDAAAGGQRLDRFVKKRYPRTPGSLVQKLLRTGRITRNRRRALASARVEVGDTVELWRDLSEFRADPEASRRRELQLRHSARFRRCFRVLHEDDSLLVLNKPAGLVVHPSQGHHHGDTLLDLLKAYIPEAFATESPYRPAFIHRLDQGTSGVLVAAKTRAAARVLENAFRQRQVEKIYVALAHGHVRPESGKIELGIGRRSRPRGPTRYWAVERAERAPGEIDPSQQGNGPSRYREAVTRYRVEEIVHRASLLRLLLGTGRTHQIRVHLAAIGHPVCGDGDYGDKQVNRHLRERHGLTRLFLHAAELEVPHPESGQPIRFAAPLPWGLRQVLESLRRRR